MAKPTNIQSQQRHNSPPIPVKDASYPIPHNPLTPTSATAANDSSATPMMTLPPLTKAKTSSTALSDIAKDEPPSLASTRVIVTVFSYGLSSLGGVFVNKACLSTYNFNHPLTLILSQLTVSLTCLTICRYFRLVTIVDRPLQDLKRLILPAVSFVLNVTIGLIALRLVNIPMFSAFRRLSVLSVLFVEFLVLHSIPSRRVLSTVFIMAFGSFLAGLGDVTYDPVGYCLVFANNFITAGNLVAIKKSSNALQLSALSMFYYVSLIALPIVTILAVITGDLRSATRDIFCTRQAELQSPGFALALSTSAASAFLINFFTNKCTQLTSPLTTAITGQMKNVLQTVLGIFAFGYVVTPLNLFGLAIALAGSILFARVKFLDAKSNLKRKHAAAAGKLGDMNQPLTRISTAPKHSTGIPLLTTLSSGLSEHQRERHAPSTTSASSRPAAKAKGGVKLGHLNKPV